MSVRASSGSSEEQVICSGLMKAGVPMGWPSVSAAVAAWSSTFLAMPKSITFTSKPSPSSPASVSASPGPVAPAGRWAIMRLAGLMSRWISPRAAAAAKPCAACRMMRSARRTGSAPRRSASASAVSPSTYSIA